MPDLSHRPTRYVTAALVVAVLAGSAATQLDLHVGNDPRLAAMQQQNEAFRLEAAKASRAERRADLASMRPVSLALSGKAMPGLTPRATTATSPTTPTAVTAAATLAATAARTAAATAAATAGKSADCARYPDQETAQAAFVRDRVRLAAMDGDHDGKACEQLRSSASPAPRIPKTEPTAPPSQPAPPAGPVLPTAPTKAALLASGMHFGMSTGTAEEFGTLEASLQRQADVNGFFSGFDTAFPRDEVVAAWNAGQIPYLTWESRPLAHAGDTTDYSLKRIIDGSFDDYLTTYAKSVSVLGLPLVIRFDQEMNGNWYRWAEFENSSLSTGDYVAAWRHVHDVFQANGANASVMWLWSPNRVDNIGRFPAIDRYYPGDAYVDEVGMTGYLRPEDKSASTFAGTYDKTLAELRRVAPGKPIVLSEVGATEDGGHKVAWLTSFFAGLAARPDITGFTWFDYAITDNGHTNDWRINSTTTAYNAFKAGLLSSGFGLDVGKRFTLRPPLPAPTPAPSTPTPTPSSPKLVFGQEPARGAAPAGPRTPAGAR